MTGPSFRSLLATVYVPSAFFGIGQGAAAPVIALTARDLGASVGVAGLVVALTGLGNVLGDLPAGRLVARIGERWSIVVGSVVGSAGVLLSLLGGSLWTLGLGVGLTGLAASVWGLARQSYLAEVVAPERRARAMSSLAGFMRLGFFTGPFLGALVIHQVGPRGGFAVQLVALVVAGILMVRLPDPEPATGPGPVHEAPRSRPGLADVVRDHRRMLSTLGAGVLLMGAARAARNAVLPLWADHIGLDAATTSMLFGIGSAVDVILSYPSGIALDRLGRRGITVASMSVLALGYAALPLAGTATALGAVAILLGIGNGMSNGVIMTIGTDVAPPATRAEFFGAWRLMHDTGMFSGPLAVAAVTFGAPLAVAAGVLAATTAVGSALMWRFVPRYVTWPLPSRSVGGLPACPETPDDVAAEPVGASRQSTP